MEASNEFRANQSKTTPLFNQKKKKVSEKEKTIKRPCGGSEGETKLWIMSTYKELGRYALVHSDLTGPTSLSNVQNVKRCRIGPTTSAHAILFYNLKRKYENADSVEKQRRPP